MKIYVLFGQRKEDYPEQCAPEALEVMDEFSYNENGEWLHEKQQEHEKNPDLVALRIVEVDLGSGTQSKIRELLVGILTLKGELKG